MINIKDKEERNNALKTFLLGGSFIMCLWIVLPYLIRTFIDPFLGSWHLYFLRWFGWLISILGYGLAVWCVVLFIRIGKGTPLPFACPKRLVIVGPYKYVRNPMILGTVLFLLGSAIFFESQGILVYALLIFLIMHLFVLIEEKHLVERFGNEYSAYRQKTPRWWPKF